MTILFNASCMDMIELNETTLKLINMSVSLGISTSVWYQYQALPIEMEALWTDT